MKDHGYYVWNPNKDRPKSQHDTVHKAIGEAERLAGEYPDQTFIVLMALGSARTERPGKFKTSVYDDLYRETPF